MTKPLLSRPKADKVSLAIFLLGLAVLSFIGSWWPALTLVFAVSQGARKFLTAKYYEAFLSLLILGGLFFAIQYNLAWMTILFVIAAIVILFQAFQNTPDDEDEEEEEIQKELEDESK